MATEIFNEIAKQTVESVEKSLSAVGKTMGTEKLIAPSIEKSPWTNQSLGVWNQTAKAEGIVKNIPAWMDEVVVNPVDNSSVTLAMYQRLEGTNPDAQAVIKMGNEICQSAADMETILHKKQEYMSFRDIERELKARGPGSHLVAGMQLELPSKKIPSKLKGALKDHYFNVYYDGKKVFAIDATCRSMLELPMSSDLEALSERLRKSLDFSRLKDMNGDHIFQELGEKLEKAPKWPNDKWLNDQEKWLKNTFKWPSGSEGERLMADVLRAIECQWRWNSYGKIVSTYAFV